MRSILGANYSSCRKLLIRGMCDWHLAFSFSLQPSLFHASSPSLSFAFAIRSDLLAFQLSSSPPLPEEFASSYKVRHYEYVAFDPVSQLLVVLHRPLYSISMSPSSKSRRLRSCCRNLFQPELLLTPSAAGKR